MEVEVCNILIFYSERAEAFWMVENITGRSKKSLKKKCCEKYKKGKRCKRCPCFDLL